MHPFLQTQMLGTTVIRLHPTLYVEFPRQRRFPLCMFATTLARLVPAVYLHYTVQGVCSNVCGHMFLPDYVHWPGLLACTRNCFHGLGQVGRDSKLLTSNLRGIKSGKQPCHESHRLEFQNVPYNNNCLFLTFLSCVICRCRLKYCCLHTKLPTRLCCNSRLTKLLRALVLMGN